MTGHVTSPLVPLPHCCRAEGQAGHWFGQCSRGSASVPRRDDCGPFLGPIRTREWFKTWEKRYTVFANPLILLDL